MQVRTSNKTKWVILGLLMIFLVIPAIVFMIASTRVEPTSMLLSIPKDSAGNIITNTLPRHTLTVIATGNNMVYYYTGSFSDTKQFNASNNKEIRKVLVQYKQEMGEALAVIIKPAQKAAYSQTVALLDEMLINNIKKYAMAEVTKDEEGLLAKQ